MFKFGFGKENITPGLGTSMMGQVEQIPCQGFYTNLFARSIYISDKKNEIIFITCDLLCLEKETADFLRTEISKKTGVSFNNIVIHTTHTHAGPAVADIFNVKKETGQTTQKIFEKIILAGEESCKNIFFGNLFYAREYMELSFNRRYIMKNGRVELHPFKDSPELFEPEGPNDPWLNILVIKDINNKIQGIITNYPCHLTSLERYNSKISADFPAYAEMELQKRFRDNKLILFYFNGACGNLCPVNIQNKDSKELGNKHSIKMGKIFSKKILKAIENLKEFGKNDKISLLYEEIKIPIRKITDKMVRKAKETLEFYKDFKFQQFKLSEYGTESYMCNDIISADALIKSDYWKYIIANELLNLYKRYKNNNTVDIPLTAIRIGKVLILTVPAELFIEYGLELRKKLTGIFKEIFLFELSNGWVGYIPTKKAFSAKEGGYEVQFLNSSKLVENAGEIIVEKLFKLANNLIKN